MQDNYGVTDSTDWHGTSVPLLGSLDATLRCQVCKDFYDAAVITGCSHTFCSRCIRRAISADGKCPACRTTAMEHSLRRNVTVQEIVDAFQLARPQALEIGRKKSEEGDSHATGPRGSKRKRLETEADPPKQLMRTRSQRRKTMEDATHENSMLIGDSDGEAEEEYLPPTDTETLHDGLVPCPICNKRMKEETVFAHLDKCDGNDADVKKRQFPSTGNLRATSTSAFQSDQRAAADLHPPPERLAQLNYSLLKERDLRKKMVDLGVSTTGSKELLVRRHKEWVNLCNSNWDSLHPRSRRELLKDLSMWERTQGGNVSQRVSASNEVMSKDFDGAGWAKQNKTDFDALIANARKGRLKSQAEAGGTFGTESKQRQAALDDKSARSSAPPVGQSAPTAAGPGETRPALTPIATDLRRNSQTSGSPSTFSPTPQPDLPSLSPYRSRRPSTAEDRIPYRRPSTASPVPGFSLPASDSPRRQSNAEKRMGPPVSQVKPPPFALPAFTSSEDFGDANHARRKSQSADPGRAMDEGDGNSDSITSLQRTDSMSSESSLPGRLASQRSQVKKLPMFEVPSEPVLDAEFGSTK